MYSYFTFNEFKSLKKNKKFGCPSSSTVIETPVEDL